MCMLTSSPISIPKTNTKRSRVECNHRNKSSSSVAGCLESLRLDMLDISLGNADKLPCSSSSGPFREDEDSQVLRGKRHSGFDSQVKSVWEDAKNRSLVNEQKEKEKEALVDRQLKSNLEALAADALMKAHEEKVKRKEVALFNQAVTRVQDKEIGTDQVMEGESYPWGGKDNLRANPRAVCAREYGSALRGQIASRKERKVWEEEREREQDALEVATNQRSLVRDIKMARMGEISRKKQWRNDLNKQIRDKRGGNTVGSR